MSIAILFGENSVQTVSSIKKSSDVRDLEAFSTGAELLMKMNRQGYQPKRLVFFAHNITDVEIKGISDFFIKHNIPCETIIIARGYDEKDVETVANYYNIQSLPLWTDYTIKAGETFGIDEVIYLVSANIDEVRRKYSINHNKEVKVVETEKVDTTALEKGEKLKPRSGKPGTIKSFSFGGKLFGKKKYTKKEALAIKKLLAEAQGVVA